MKIQTTDKNGKKIIVDYSVTEVEEKEPETDIKIENYHQFRMCVRRSNEESQYSNGAGDKRYERALADLVRNDHEAYQRYYQKMLEEHRG